MHEDFWIGEFGCKAAPRLRALFEEGLEDMPQLLLELMQRLNQSERTRDRQVKFAA